MRLFVEFRGAHRSVAVDAEIGKQIRLPAVCGFPNQHEVQSMVVLLQEPRINRGGRKWSGRIASRSINNLR